MSNQKASGPQRIQFWTTIFCATALLILLLIEKHFNYLQ